MRYEIGDRVVTRYTRIRCVVTSTSDLTVSGLQRLELTCRQEVMIRDSDMVETDNYKGVTIEDIRVLADRYVQSTGRPVCIIHCKSFGYNLMEVPKARGRKIIETIYPPKP